MAVAFGKPPNDASEAGSEGTMYTGSGTKWYAVRTAAGREKAVSGQLANKGYEQFLPMYRTRRQWSDRVKELELPLFPGYLFCRFDVNSRLPILVTPGVTLIVGYGKAPISISDGEIEAVRTVTKSGAAAEPWPFLEAGQRVRIQDGSLGGLEGLLLQVKNSWRIVLSVELLQRSVAVEVDRASVVPVGRATAHVYCKSNLPGAWMPAADGRGFLQNSGD
jgi:transcription antitermination factor NusG